MLGIESLDRSDSEVEVVGLADELDPGELQVPDAEEFGRGRRRRRVTQKYGEFVVH